jgi:ribosomal protein S18 acetylase RimI-like enzyme
MNVKSFSVQEEELTQELKDTIYEGFKEHALHHAGSDGGMQEITFVAREAGQFIGAVHAKTFWGGLHIKYLFVAPESRDHGIGKVLMLKALDKGMQMGCRFAFVETMNFQGVEFYKSLGFVEEFVRSGFDKNTSFHYLKKNFRVKPDQA